MGSDKKYLEEGGFSEYEYRIIDVVNGMKLIQIKGTGHTNTPMRSNTPYTAYAKIDPNKGEVVQVSVYGREGGRKKIKDIDIGHEHGNVTNKKIFSEQDIHVHEYIGDKRKKDAREPSSKERRLIMLARNKVFKG